MKLFSKLFWSFTVIFLSFVIFFLIFSYRSINNNYLKTSSHYLKEFDKLLTPQILPMIKAHDFAGLDNYFKELELEIRLTYISPEGLVLADSDNQIEQMDNHADRPEILSAKENGTGIKWRFSNTMGLKMLYYAHRFDADGYTQGYLRLSFYDYQIEELRSGLLENVSRLLILGIFVALLVTFLLSRHFLKPVHRLVKATREIKQGDFSIRLKPRTKDEIQELSLSFNSMLDHVQQLINQTKSQKEALRKIIESLSDLLWVVDAKSEKITIYNSAFLEFLHIEKADDKHYWEVIRSLEINNIIKEALNNHKPQKQEISLMNHDFILSANYLWETNSLIFLLSDVTPFRQLEQVKRDIVANASHELRTPLVSIKGYTELLAERITGEDKKIVQILERNINRLSSLVNDILVLSHLEKTADLDLGLTNVSQILDNVCLLYKLRLKEKSLVLHKNYEPGIIAQIDAFRFEQLVNNLLDNAIKYTLEGSITLSLSRCENELVFECCDTGVGIPENLIPRVFERFYTVDKSRSRKLGGTGLGLSIVKHIVNLHQGKISLNSDFGKGSCFKVTLPATR